MAKNRNKTNNIGLNDFESAPGMGKQQNANSSRHPERPEKYGSGARIDGFGFL